MYNDSVRAINPVEYSTIRQSQVSEQMTELVSATELLEKQLIELDERLNIVLRPQGDVLRDENVVKQPEPLVPLADHIRQRVWHIQKLQDKVMGILQRIEI